MLQKTNTQFYFSDNFGNLAPILTILSLLQAANLWRVNVKFFHPPHLYCVTTLPSKTNTTADIAMLETASIRRRYSLILLSMKSCDSF